MRRAGDDQQRGGNECHRQQQIKRDAGEIGIEITDGFETARGEGAHDRRRRRDARCRRDEHVHGEAEHLRAVGDLRLRHVGLPVGVSGEAGRRVEGQARRHRGDVLRVERQIILQAQNGVEQEEMDDAEQD